MTMKILRKTLVSVLFFMCICIGTSAEAKEKPTSGKDDNGIQWTYDKTTKTLTFSGNKRMAEDASMDGHSPEVEWSCWSEEAEQIILQEGIQGVGGGVFDGFGKVHTVQLPESVTRIDELAFAGCLSLKSITLPSKLKKIGEYAFDGCESLEDVVIPTTVISIGNGAFSGCYKLKGVKIPEGVNELGTGVFSYCKNLENVGLPSNLKKIPANSFKGCVNLRKVVIPSSVTQIGTAAFAGTGIKEIVIPANVTKFYKKSRYSYKRLYPLFKNCKNLRKVTIKSRKIKSIHRHALRYVNKKTTICVPKSKLKTYKKMFRKAGLSKKVKVRAI